MKLSKIIAGIFIISAGMLEIEATNPLVVTREFNNASNTQSFFVSFGKTDNCVDLREPDITIKNIEVYSNICKRLLTLAWSMTSQDQLTNEIENIITELQELEDFSDKPALSETLKKLKDMIIEPTKKFKTSSKKIDVIKFIVRQVQKTISDAPERYCAELMGGDEQIKKLNTVANTLIGLHDPRTVSTEYADNAMRLLAALEVNRFYQQMEEDLLTKYTPVESTQNFQNLECVISATKNGSKLDRNVYIILPNFDKNVKITIPVSGDQCFGTFGIEIKRRYIIVNGNNALILMELCSSEAKPSAELGLFPTYRSAPKLNASKAMFEGFDAVHKEWDATSNWEDEISIPEKVNRLINWGNKNCPSDPLIADGARIECRKVNTAYLCPRKKGITIVDGILNCDAVSAESKYLPASAEIFVVPTGLNIDPSHLPEIPPVGTFCRCIKWLPETYALKITRSQNDEAVNMDRDSLMPEEEEETNDGFQEPLVIGWNTKLIEVSGFRQFLIDMTRSERYEDNPLILMVEPCVEVLAQDENGNPWNEE